MLWFYLGVGEKGNSVTQMCRLNTFTVCDRKWPSDKQSEGVRQQFMC